MESKESKTPLGEDIPFGEAVGTFVLEKLTESFEVNPDIPLAAFLVKSNDKSFTINISEHDIETDIYNPVLKFKTKIKSNDLERGISIKISSLTGENIDEISKRNKLEEIGEILAASYTMKS